MEILIKIDLRYQLNLTIKIGIYQLGFLRDETKELKRRQYKIIEL